MERKIIVPAKDNDDSDNSAVVDRTVRFMCKRFGGATVYEAKGYWVNEHDRLFVDDVFVIISAAIADESDREALRGMARDILGSTDQEAVFISLDGEAEIIE